MSPKFSKDEMGIMKKLIEEFNRLDTYLIISDYPEKTSRGQKNYGIAWYTKEIIEPIAKKHNVRFVVLAEKGFDNTPKTYAQGRILVLRVFDQKHPSLFPVILQWLWKFDKIKNIHVHSEFCANGGVKNMVLILPFLALIKLNNKKITYFSHNVISTLANISTHLNISKGSLKYKLLNSGISYYYKALGILVDKFVVMDEAIGARLEEFVPKKKIFLNPFWVPKTNKTISMKQSRKKLEIPKDDFLLLYFGFITHYKGADWIIKTVRELRKQKKFKKLHLVLAGGQAYSLKEKAYYQKYYQELLETIKNEPNIQITGFVPEQKIGTYFQAANLAVFPYRGLIGGSGALMHALAYKTPFVVSRKMSEILDGKHTQEALSKTDIQKKDMTFSHTTESFKFLLSKGMKPDFNRKLKTFSSNFAELRDKNLLLDDCYNELYGGKKLTSFRYSTFPALKTAKNG